MPLQYTIYILNYFFNKEANVFQSNLELENLKCPHKHYSFLTHSLCSLLLVVKF